MRYHILLQRHAARSCGLLAIAALTGCSDAPPVAPWGSEVWPLAVGSGWVFRVVEYDSAGILLSRRTETLSVLRDTTLGEAGVVLSHDPLRLVAGGLTVAAARRDGLWKLLDASQGHLVYKFPAAIGEEYTVSSGGFAFKMHVAALRERRTVPAGRFDCVRYERVKFAAYCLAPGIGPVWAEFRLYTCPGDVNSCALSRRTVVELLRAELR